MICLVVFYWSLKVKYPINYGRASYFYIRFLYGTFKDETIILKKTNRSAKNTKIQDLQDIVNDYRISSFKDQNLGKSTDSIIASL